MTDFILIVTIIAFFVAAALIVRACGGLTADVAEDGGGEKDGRA